MFLWGKGRSQIDSRLGLLNVIFLFQITQLKIDHNPFAKGFRDNYDK